MNMVSHMKTTIELPDEILIEAKRRAAAERRPLRALIAEGLRRVLADPEPGAARRRKKIAWVTAPGGLPPVDVADREALHDWLRRSR